MDFLLNEKLITNVLQLYLKPYVLGEINFHFDKSGKNGGINPVIENVTLNPSKFNELLTPLCVPFIINDAYVEKLSIHCCLSPPKINAEVLGLKVTLIPSQDSEISEEMAASMSESFYDTKVPAFVEGFAKLASETEGYKDIHAVEASKRIFLSFNDVFEATFIDTAVRVEHFVGNSAYGVALELRIGLISVGKENIPTSDEDNKGRENEGANPKFSRNVCIKGVRLYTEEVMRSVPSSFDESTVSEGSLSESFHRQDSTPIKILAIPNAINVVASFNSQPPYKSNFLLTGSVPQIVMFISPRQIYLLSEVVTELTRPRKYIKPPKSIPLTQEDYDLIERAAAAAEYNSANLGPTDTESHVSGRIPSASMASGWSVPKTSGMQPSLPREGYSRTAPSHVSNYQHLNQPGYCNTMSDTESLMASSVITYQTQMPVYDGTAGLDHDDKANNDPINIIDDKLIALSIQSITIVVLHEDVIASIGATASHKELEHEAEVFFALFDREENISDCASSTSEEKIVFDPHTMCRIVDGRRLVFDADGKFELMREHLATYIAKSHFLLQTSSIHLDTSNRRRNVEVKQHVLAKVQNMELVECFITPNLMDRHAAPDIHFLGIVLFMNDGLLAGGNPCLNFSFDCSSRIENSYMGLHTLGSSVTNVTVAITNCVTEIDLSIIDRTEAFFQKPTFFDDDVQDSAAVDEPQLPSFLRQHSYKLLLSCASLDVRLFFPIPDLRPISEVLTKKVWQRNVRTDILNVQLVDLEGSIFFTKPTGCITDAINVNCRTVSVSFQESPDTERYTIAEAVCRGETDRVEIIIKHASGKKSVNNLPDNQKPEPFYEKILISNHTEAISEPLLYPAAEGVFGKFMSENCADADVRLDITVPALLIYLPSKHTYEVIYNRLAYDLLLWTPHSAHPLMTKSKISKSSPNNTTLGTTLSDQSMYHSTTGDIHQEDISFPNSASPPPCEARPTQPKTQFFLNVKIDESTVEMYTPHRDRNGEMSAATYGRIVIETSNTMIFVASGFNGDVNKSYIGVYSHTLKLGHHPTFYTEINEHKDMTVIVRRCTADELKNVSTNPTEETDMLSLVIDLSFDEINNVTEMILAGKLNHAFYNYEAIPAQDTWLMQILDEFTVEDYPIQGYSMPDVLKNLHFSLMNCLVKYRPKEDFDTDLLMYVGSMIVASTLSVSSDATINRCVTEDTSFYLRKEIQGLTPIYAEILNLGVLQVIVRMALTKSKKMPDLEIVVVGAVVTLITCSDTLAEIMKYVTHFGENSSAASFDDELEGMQELSTAEKPAISDEAYDEERRQREALLAEAINEIHEGDTDDAGDSFSPPKKSRDRHKKNKNHHRKGAASTTDSYSVLKQKVRVERPEIRYEKDVSWPAGKFQLSHVPPKMAEVPDYRYCIKEVSLSWKLCAGRALSPERSSPAVVTPPPPSSVSYNNRDSRLSLNHPSPVAKRKDCPGRRSYKDLRTMVDIQVKKLRYTAEFFNPKSLSVCRHAISAKEIEILDAVPTSSLKKFLGRYITDEYPVCEKSEFLRVVMSVKKKPKELDCEECDLEISMGNVRIFADQATIQFLYDFFREMSQICDENHAHYLRKARARAVSQGLQSVATTRHNSPVLQTTQMRTAEDQQKLFFKSVVFNPAVVIIIDFEGNFSDVNSLNELVFALSSANKIEIKLKSINHHRGLLGSEKVMEYLRNQWVDDICDNQKFNIIKMIAPVGLLMEIVGGMWQLIESPFQQYMKDGNVFRGLVIGSRAFTCRSMAATFGLLGKMFSCMENVASYLMVIVTPTYRIEGNAVPPSDAIAGVCEATSIIKQRMVKVTTNVIKSTQKERRERGMAGAVSGFARHIPEMVVTPPLLATQATGRILTGLQHQWTPGNDREIHQKYK